VLVGAIAGGIGTASWMASQRFRSSQEAGAERIAADRAHAEKETGSDEKED
jgi:hypothetical protein